jgi:hypothetical protein
MRRADREANLTTGTQRRLAKGDAPVCTDARSTTFSEPFTHAKDRSPSDLRYRHGRPHHDATPRRSAAKVLSASDQLRALRRSAYPSTGRSLPTQRNENQMVKKRSQAATVDTQEAGVGVSARLQPPKQLIPLYKATNAKQTSTRGFNESLITAAL